MGGQVGGSPNLAPNSIPMVRVDLDVHQIVGWSLFWSSPARRSLVTLGLTSYTSSNGHLLFLPQSALLIGGCPIAILAMAKCWAHVAKRVFSLNRAMPIIISFGWFWCWYFPHTDIISTFTFSFHTVEKNQINAACAIMHPLGQTILGDSGWLMVDFGNWQLKPTLVRT